MSASVLQTSVGHVRSITLKSPEKIKALQEVCLNTTNLNMPKEIAELIIAQANMRDTTNIEESLAWKEDFANNLFLSDAYNIRIALDAIMQSAIDFKIKYPLNMEGKQLDFIFAFIATISEWRCYWTGYVNSEWPQLDKNDCKIIEECHYTREIERLNKRIFRNNDGSLESERKHRNIWYEEIKRYEQWSSTQWKNDSYVKEYFKESSAKKRYRKKNVKFVNIRKN